MIETDSNAPSGPLPAQPRLRFGKLNTLGGVLDEMARLYKSARRDELPTSDASRLCFMLSQLRRSIEATDIEKRLADLEARVREVVK